MATTLRFITAAERRWAHPLPPLHARTFAVLGAQGRPESICSPRPSRQGPALPAPTRVRKLLPSPSWTRPWRGRMAAAVARGLQL
jgi:hypothetical protein